MKVADVMTRDPQVVSPEASIRQALKLMREGGFRRVPVVREGVLVGILSERDLRQAMNTPVLVHEKKLDDYVLDQVKVGMCMSTQVYTLNPEDPLDKAARIMKEKKVGGCPVTEGGELVGIITESDLLDYLIRSIQEGRLL